MLIIGLGIIGGLGATALLANELYYRWDLNKLYKDCPGLKGCTEGEWQAKCDKFAAELNMLITEHYKTHDRMSTEQYKAARYIARRHLQ